MPGSILVRREAHGDGAENGVWHLYSKGGKCLRKERVLN